MTTTTLDLEHAISALYSGKRLRLASGTDIAHLVWRSPHQEPTGICHEFSMGSGPVFVPLSWKDSQTSGAVVRRFLAGKMENGWVISVQGSVQPAKKG